MFYIPLATEKPKNISHLEEKFGIGLPVPALLTLSRMQEEVSIYRQTNWGDGHATISEYQYKQFETICEYFPQLTHEGKLRLVKRIEIADPFGYFDPRKKQYQLN